MNGRLQRGKQVHYPGLHGNKAAHHPFPTPERQMHSLSSPSAGNLGSLLEHYLPLSPEQGVYGYDQAYDFHHLLSVYIVHSTVLALLRDASGSVDQILPGVYEAIQQIEEAHPAWIAAVERFAKGAPQLQAEVDALPCEAWDSGEPFAQWLEQHFFAPFAPQRSGAGGQADAIIREQLCDLKHLEFEDVKDVVSQLQWALEGIPQAARLYRLLLAKWSYDCDVENNRVRTARAIGQTFGLEGVRLRGDDSWGAFSDDLESYGYPGWPLLPLDQLTDMLRVTWAEWRAQHPEADLDDFKRWLYSIACWLERHRNPSEPAYA
jgi:hypothetical protein